MVTSNGHLRRAAWLCGLDDAELAAAKRSAGAPASYDTAPLRSLLVCPSCRGELEWSDRIHCTACSAEYELTDGIPVLRLPDTTGSDTHKEHQATFSDEADPEFEITRPHGTPALYRWLLAEKFRRSLDALPPCSGETVAVTICAGSGMDAEFVSRAGPSVISTDISLGAARRARERARRYGLDVLSIVADAEMLPFRDRSVDLVYVHDGLHHLESPEAGLREMLRVSRSAISVNEPARAGATLLAARLGLAQHYEEAGNFIARMDPAALAQQVSAAGFEIVKSERYAMVYRHVPGRAAELLSRPGVRSLTQAAVRIFNGLAGATGNKLTLQAVRPEQPPD